MHRVFSHCLAVLVAFASPGFHQRPFAAEPETTLTASAIIAKKAPDPTRFEKTIAAFESTTETVPTNAIIAYGSSSIRGWHKTIREDLAPLPIIPRGFGGSNMYDALHFMDRVIVPHKPRAVLLYEGDNDVAAEYPTAEIAAKYREFINRMHAALPSTRIYIISVKPSPLRWKFWPAMQALNAELKKMADGDPLVTYLDVATPMLDKEGKPQDEIFLADKLHMNRQGYEIWKSVVRPVLLEDEKTK